MQLNGAELTIRRAETGHISSTILSPLAFRVLPLSTISTIASAIPKIGQAQRCLNFNYRYIHILCQKVVLSHLRILRGYPSCFVTLVVIARRGCKSKRHLPSQVQHLVKSSPCSSMVSYRLCLRRRQAPPGQHVRALAKTTSRLPMDKEAFCRGSLIRCSRSPSSQT